MLYYIGPTVKKMTLSTKPEVTTYRNATREVLSHDHSEHCTENLVKFDREEQADRQTKKQLHITIMCTPFGGEVNI